MKTLDDVAKAHGIDNIDLGNAVEAILASRKGSFLESYKYERGMSKKFTQREWDVAHQIADVYEKRGK